MTHKITIPSNPRILIIFFFAVALPVGGVFLTILFNIFLGIVVTIVAGFIGYHLLKFGISSLKSWVQTDEDGLTICTADDDPQHIEWAEITHAGSVFQPKTRDIVFVYAENRDKLITVPNEYSEFDALTKVIAERTVNADFEEVHLEQTQTITDYLKERVVPQEEHAAETQTEIDDSASAESAPE